MSANVFEARVADVGRLLRDERHDAHRQRRQQVRLLAPFVRRRRRLDVILDLRRGGMSTSLSNNPSPISRTVYWYWM